MARLEYDFADPNEAGLFPTHGWAINSQGVKILWCPLHRLVAFPDGCRPETDACHLESLRFP